MASEILYKKIFQELLDKIGNGEFPVGSRLPSEMELADQYNVSRVTSKKALELLADKGIVFRQPGKGTFVSNELPEQLQSLCADDDGEEQETTVAKKRMAIGVIFDGMNSAFGMDILCGIEYECARRNMMMMFRLTYGSVEMEKKALRDMIDAGVAGIILMCVQDKTYNEELLKLYLNQFPIVLVDRKLKGISIPVVTTDNYSASYELTSYLLQKGHTNIGYISHSHQDTSTVDERYRGFCDALHASGVLLNGHNFLLDMDAFIPKDDDNVVNLQAYEHHISEFIDSHPDVTAFFAVEYSIAKLIYVVLLKKGMVESKDLVYFDGFPKDGVLPLSQNSAHVIQNQFKMGVVAIRNLTHKIRGEKIPDCEYLRYDISGI